MLSLVFVISLCAVPTLPGAGQDSNAVNKQLTKVLIDCFGHLGPEIRCSKVDVSGPENLPSSVYDGGTGCGVINPGRLLLQEGDGELLLASLAHEVGHIKIEADKFLLSNATREQMEHLSDMVIAQTFPQGACMGSKFLEWLVKVPRGSAPDFERIVRDMVRQRMIFQQSVCLVQRGIFELKPK